MQSVIRKKITVSTEAEGGGGHFHIEIVGDVPTFRVSALKQASQNPMIFQNRSNISQRLYC